MFAAYKTSTFSTIVKSEKETNIATTQAKIKPSLIPKPIPTPSVKPAKKPTATNKPKTIVKPRSNSSAKIFDYQVSGLVIED